MKKIAFILFLTMVGCASSNTSKKKKTPPEDIAKLKFGIKVANVSNDIHGIVIEKVYANYPANKAGLVKGDIIIKLENKPILDVESFNELIKNYKYRYGQVFITITKNNELKRIPLYLE